MSPTAPRYTVEELLAAEARFVHHRPVLFQEIDAAGITFFAAAFAWFHDAFAALLDDAGVPLHRVIAEGTWGAPVRHAEADFLKPVRFGDRLAVEVVAARLDGSTLTIGYRVRGDDGVPRAVGQVAHVCIDRASFRRIEAPEALRALVLSRFGAV